MKRLGLLFKNFDGSFVKGMVRPRAADDLNSFLEKLPQNTGQTMLVVAGAVWVFAGATGLYTTVQIQNLTKMRVELQEAEALRPIVPEIRNVAVNPNEIKQFIQRAEKIYGGLDMKAQGSSIVVTANTLSAFGQFREAIGHVQNGGAGWRVSVERLCVGRECDREPLAAVLKINKVSVQKQG